jgi:hypothetical protein
MFPTISEPGSSSNLELTENGIPPNLRGKTRFSNKIAGE